MSTPASPGWHDDPAGRRRWWDGQRWGAYAPWDEGSAGAPRPQAAGSTPLRLDRRLLRDPTPSSSARTAEPVPVRRDEPAKSLAIATLLVVLLGYFGAHRFYLGRTASAFAMLSLTLVGCMLLVVGVPLILAAAAWWLVDIALTHRMVRQQDARAAQAPRRGVYRGWPSA